MRRLSQVAWVVRYLPDIESDMSAFHRVDDVYLMPGPRFFSLARRLGTYQGAMAARLHAERDEPQQRPAQSRPAVQAAAPARQQPTVAPVPATKAALLSNPAFRINGQSIFSFGKAS